MSEVFFQQEAEQAETDPLLQLVSFNIGEEIFGVNILMVQEIIRSTPVTPIPDSPPFIEGVINLRGNIIPVIDLRKRLDMTLQKHNTDKVWIIILNINSRTAGFIVDFVSDVLKVAKTDIKPPPDIVSAGLNSQYIKGVCNIEKGLLVLLDFNRILMIDEIKKLKDIEEKKAI